jgi:hypothetical protein
MRPWGRGPGAQRQRIAHDLHAAHDLGILALCRE